MSTMRDVDWPATHTVPRNPELGLVALSLMHLITCKYLRVMCTWVGQLGMRTTRRSHWQLGMDSGQQRERSSP